MEGGYAAGCCARGQMCVAGTEVGQEVVNESQCALLVVDFKVSTGGP